MGDRDLLDVAMSRRRFIGLSGLVVLGGPAALAACSSAATPNPTATPATSLAPVGSLAPAASPSVAATPAPLTGKLVVNLETGSYNYAQTNAWVVPFRKQNPGVNVIVDERELDIPFIDAMHTSGKITVDEFSACPSGFTNVQMPDYFEPIDYTVVNKDELLEGYFGDTWVTSAVSVDLLGYNTDKFKDKVPTSLADIFNTKDFPGKRTFENRWDSTCSMALMADGVAPESLHPLDVPRALAKLATIKKDIVWFDSGSQVQELIASGEAPIGVTYNGRLMNSVLQGAHVAGVWTGGFMLEIGYWVVLKGSPDKDAAMALIALATSKEYAGGLTNYGIAYPGVNKNQIINPAAVDWVPDSHLNLPHVLNDITYLDWVAANAAKYQEMFQTFQTS